MKTLQTTSQPRTVGEVTFFIWCNLKKHLLDNEFQQNLGRFGKCWKVASLELWIDTYHE